MNRRIRNRTYGGVGGRREQSRLLPDLKQQINVFEVGLVHQSRVQHDIQRYELLEVGRRAKIV